MNSMKIERDRLRDIRKIRRLMRKTLLLLSIKISALCSCRQTGRSDQRMQLMLNSAQCFSAFLNRFREPAVLPSDFYVCATVRREPALPLPSHFRPDDCSACGHAVQDCLA